MGLGNGGSWGRRLCSVQLHYWRVLLTAVLLNRDFAIVYILLKNNKRTFSGLLLTEGAEV